MIADCVLRRKWHIADDGCGEIDEFQGKAKQTVRLRGHASGARRRLPAFLQQQPWPRVGWQSGTGGRSKRLVT
jgi:hypothetical protein